MNTGTAKSSNLAAAFLGELQHEAATTRKVLERISEDKFDFKPHEKSLTMGVLATHVAEMFNWIKITLETDALDFAAGDYVPAKPQTTAELVEVLDRHVAEAVESLNNAADETFMADWSLKNGAQTYFTMPKIQVLRSFCFNHIIHHRGQLSLYLRMNDIPVPALYGPSADEGQM